MVLQNQHSEVLSVDVARHMNFLKPSVCHAVKQLKGKGFLDVYEDGSLHLTEEGRKLAEGVYERHLFFTEYLMEMGYLQNRRKKMPVKWNTLFARKVSEH